MTWGVEVIEVRDRGLGLRTLDLGFRVWGPGLKASGFRLSVLIFWDFAFGFQLWVLESRLRVWG
jgi:hypothetical protein